MCVHVCVCTCARVHVCTCVSGVYAYVCVVIRETAMKASKPEDATQKNTQRLDPPLPLTQSHQHPTKTHQHTYTQSFVLVCC